MKDNKLNIGRIPYANLFPLFHYLDTECDNSAYRFTRGVPSKLNKMLRSGELDISPSSSIEYLRNKDRYSILPWLSVSSSGPIKSILLFSELPINSLEGKTVAVTSDSETSTALLKVIFREFLSIKCRYRPTGLHSVNNILSSFPAVLHIGDTAMLEARKYNQRIETAGAKKQKPLHIYDLGELWYEHTGLPFVFALWVIRKKAFSQKKELMKRLSSDLLNAKKFAKENLPLIASEAPQKKWLSEKDLIDYWEIISYDFTEEHLEGLKLFEKYASRL
ncbi:MAG: menaquinone biosynthesis protein [Nitrospirota bacterium]|nr:menaquinone biosynthesis protein [Nitrospirota bacterium]